MIKKIIVRPEFEKAKKHSGNGRERGFEGFPIRALPVGHKINTDSYLVLLIGENGSGKSTFLEKLSAQYMGFGNEYFYFDTEGEAKFEEGYQIHSYNLDYPYNEKENFKDEEIRSHGEYSLYYIPKFLKERHENSPKDGIYFDEPENGISMKNKSKLVNMISDFAFSKKQQVFVATHEPEFLKINDALVINMDEYPATSCRAEDFDLEKYMGTPQQNQLRIKHAVKTRTRDITKNFMRNIKYKLYFTIKSKFPYL